MIAVPSLKVHYLPQFVAESDLAGDCVVVIDLLRASTTICQALAAGAKSIRPLREVGAAVREASAWQGQVPLMLGGERGGERIEGFDLGNSPAEYVPDQVFGRRILFTTTNGTVAIEHARLASRTLIGAAANLSAVVEALANEKQVHLLCAGTNGHVSRDDQLIAGAIAHGMAQHEPSPRERNDSASAVSREWEELLNTATALGRSASDQLALELCDTPGGKNLLAIGMEDDLPRCAQIDTLRLVPEHDRKSGWIILAPGQ